MLAGVTPVALPLVMLPVFRGAVRRYGDRRGYQAAFAVYWATCWATALGIAGPRRIARAWQPADPALPDPRGLALAAVIVPPAGAVATQWLPHARRTGPVAVVVALGVGVTNALAEDALWRALPITLFPDDPWRGWLRPAAGFAAWHLVPLAVRPAERGARTGLLVGATLIGLGHGWVAQRTGSVRLVSVAHAVTDACGVRQARDVWLAGSVTPSG